MTEEYITQQNSIEHINNYHIAILYHQTHQIISFYFIRCYFMKINLKRLIARINNEYLNLNYIAVYCSFAMII